MADRPLSSPGVRFPPPLIFVGGLALAALLDAFVPAPVWARSTPRGWLIFGLALATASVLWMGWALVTFLRARTGILPHHPASRIVTSGPYGFGRNPMYLGMSGLYWAFALWMNSVWAIALFPVVLLLVRRLVIEREERYLSQAFGEEYARYRERVGRWLGRSRSGS